MDFVKPLKFYLVLNPICRKQKPTLG